MLKRVLLIMLALVSMSCVSTVAHSDNRSESSQSTLYETPDLILDEKVLDTPSLDTRIRARDIINGEDMTMVKKTAFPIHDYLALRMGFDNLCPCLAHKGQKVGRL